MNSSFDPWSSWGPADLGQTRAAQQRQLPQVPADHGLVVEERETGWVGAVLGVSPAAGMNLVTLEDRSGRTRDFPLGFGFLVDGRSVELVPPPRQKPVAAARRRTASGSLAVENVSARTARASRIWVEGLHDAELVEKVWGDDLRIEGIVVEPLHGADDLAAAVREFGPAPHRRLAVLLDHLVPGSKESRLAAEASAVPGAADNLLILGHPYVDVWQAVKPQRLGLDAWPQIPRGTDIKVGTCRALGWPAENRSDVAAAWKRILSQVRSYTDLEPALLGRVEEIIDFVSAAEE